MKKELRYRIFALTENHVTENDYQLAANPIIAVIDSVSTDN